VPLKVLANCLRNFSCSRVSVSIDCSRYFGTHHLHAVAVEADQLAQERGRQQVLPGLFSCSKMICASTDRVMSSPVLAS